MKLALALVLVLIVGSVLAANKTSVFKVKKDIPGLPREGRGKIQVRVNHKFTVDLPLNISGGYIWRLWKVYAVSTLKFQEPSRYGTYVKPRLKNFRRPKEVILRQHFTFLPIKLGKAVLEFWHIQPWLNKVKHKYKMIVQINTA
eukprot:TRINITY_DN9957_c0_g1_i2.p1 TRINITY_DN9957_c0_g1~~TRINITY_DN9957_c0_g1_i2.p1  ORF type:complete len:144 (-),score=24.87 TRINITY_DN9957_c0_g1_i2:196-627(-)